MLAIKAKPIDFELQTHLIAQVMQTVKGIVSEEDKKAYMIALDRTRATLNGMKPQDELEALLIAQMIAVHNLAMNYMAKAAQTQDVDRMATYYNGATKLLRTYVAQLEALKKYRMDYRQKIQVTHVHDGGQAIVGDVNHGGKR